MGGETENPARSAITLGIPGRSGDQGSFLAEPGTGPAAGKQRRAERVLVRFRGCAPPAREPGGQCGHPGTRTPLISRGVSFGIAVLYRIEHSQATVTWRSGPRRPGSLRRGAVSRGAHGLARVGGRSARAEFSHSGRMGLGTGVPGEERQGPTLPPAAIPPHLLPLTPRGATEFGTRDLCSGVPILNSGGSTRSLLSLALSVPV